MTSPMPPAPPSFFERFSGRRLVQGAGLNLLAQGIPLVVVLFTLPFVLRDLGLVRYGILTVCLAAYTYFGFMDFGVSRAATRKMADSLSTEGTGVREIFWTALGALAVLGSIGMGVLVLLSPFLMTAVLSVPSDLQAEAISAMTILGFTLPFSLLVSGMRGALDAAGSYRVTSAIRLVSSTVASLAPILVIQWSARLEPILLALLLLRGCEAVIHLLAARRVLPLGSPSVSAGVAKELFRFGGWVTVSNVLSPLMVTADRLLIGALLAVSLIPFYASPYDLVTRLWLIPQSASLVLFPAFSALEGRPGEVQQLYARASKWLLLLMLPVTLLAALFSREFLSLWLGQEFALRSTLVMQILLLGVFVNSQGHTSFWLLQAKGRPDISAKLHALEVPLYLITAWFLILNFQLVGAAIAWLLRVGADAALHIFFAQRMQEQTGARPHAWLLLLAPVLFGLVMLMPDLLLLKLASAAFFLAALAVVTWKRLLDPQERRVLATLRTRGG